MLLRRYPRRSVVVLALMVSQAFFYNAIFFTYALVLTRFYGVADDAGRPLHPALRGRQRARAAAARAAVRPHRPARDDRARPTRCRAWACCSPAWASSTGVLDATHADAGLVGGVLPRVGGGELGLPHGERSVPARDARARDLDLLRGRHRRGRLRGAGAVRRADRERRAASTCSHGYVVGAVLVLVAAVIAWRYGVDAERKPLEEIAPPLGTEGRDAA